MKYENNFFLITVYYLILNGWNHDDTFQIYCKYKFFPTSDGFSPDLIVGNCKSIKRSVTPIFSPSLIVILYIIYHVILQSFVFKFVNIIFDHSIIRKICQFNCIKMLYRLTNIFSIKSVIDTEVLLSDVRDLKRYSPISKLLYFCNILL